MKILNIFYIVVFITNVSHAQVVKFEKTSSWDTIVKTAKDQNKNIFVDCYATTCGPCKLMEKEVFSNKSVGDVLNEKFINIRLQFDSTNNDTQQTKEMFLIARTFEKVYKIKAFPTYLIFDKNGTILFQESGAVTPRELFLAKINAALIPDNQYYTLKRKYQSGDSSASVVRKLLPEAIKLEDWSIAFSAHDKFVNEIDSPYSKENLFSVCASLPNSEGMGFNFIRRNTVVINTLLNDEGRAQMIIKSCLNKEVFSSYIKDKKEVNWDEVISFLNHKAPELSTQTLMEIKMDYARGQGDWNTFGKLKMDYYDLYADSFDHNTKWFMNNELMEIFNFCSDKKILIRAADWSKKSIYREPGKESPAAMDTYANLLYKIGKKFKAIAWQKKAIRIVGRDPHSDVSEYQENLNKMYSGTPTWKFSN